MRPAILLRPLLWVAPALLLALASVAAPAGKGAVDRLATKRAAARIDSLLEKALGEAGLSASDPAEEGEWLRRTYLEVLGRIPTPEEIRAYGKSSSSDRALDLVDDLLGARGHESRLYNWWADLLRVKSRLPKQISGEPYAHWLRTALAENRHYDDMVRELLEAEGPAHARGNGATGYLMRDRNMPEDNMSNTIRLFLGSRVECAQCHNHPFDKWTQRQYYEMVAFTGGIEYQKRPRGDPRAMKLIAEAQKRWGRNGPRALARTLEPTFDGIYGSGSGATHLPSDYHYDDAAAGSWVTAKPLFQPAVALDVRTPGPQRAPRRAAANQRRGRQAQAPEVDSRKAFAEWLTSPENERFATVISNRIWRRVFGRGLIEPVDDLKDDTKAAAPELMEYLRQLMIDVDFDLREFERALLYTRHWRRSAVAPAETPGDAEDLRGPLLRRMSAEQAWDSLLTLVVPDLDATIAPPLGPRAEMAYRTYEGLAQATDEEVMERAALLVLRYTDPAEFRKQQQAERVRRRNEMRREMLATDPTVRQRLRAGRALRDLQRASDLPSPAPPGHLLSEFGQSERDLIDASHTDPTVPQVLALLNSFLEQRVLSNRDAVLMKALAENRDAAGKVRSAFLAVLGRAPTPSEMSSWERDVSKGGNKAAQDLVWTLVNSHEFLFLQ